MSEIALWGEMCRHVNECKGNVLLVLCCTLKERSVGGVAVVYLLKLTVPIGHLWGRFLQNDQRISGKTFLLPTHNAQHAITAYSPPADTPCTTGPIYTACLQGKREGGFFFGRCWVISYLIVGG